MTIKAIIMDIDGTLVNTKKVMTEETRQALLKAQASGVKLILASGRPYNGLVELGKQLEMDQNNGIFVCFNGSKVVDFATEEVLFNQPLSIEEGKAVLRHLKKFNARPMIDKGEYMYVNNVFDCYINYNGNPKHNIMEYEARGNHYILCEKRDLEAFCDFELNKILTFADPEYLQEHYKEMAAPFEGKINCMFTAPFYFEYTAKGIDKTKAIQTVLEPMGIYSENIIAFGDAQNDKTMIQYAGIGVAMGNATDELKAVADDVTLSNDEDGIAKSLYKYLPEVFA